jgi:hypothetical protein
MLRRSFRALLLQMREAPVEKDDSENRKAEIGHPGQDGEQSRDPEHDGEEMEELRSKLLPTRSGPETR